MNNVGNLDVVDNRKKTINFYICLTSLLLSSIFLILFVWLITRNFCIEYSDREPYIASSWVLFNVTEITIILISFISTIIVSSLSLLFRKKRLKNIKDFKRSNNLLFSFTIISIECILWFIINYFLRYSDAREYVGELLLEKTILKTIDLCLMIPLSFIMCLLLRLKPLMACGVGFVVLTTVTFASSVFLFVMLKIINSDYTIAHVIVWIIYIGIAGLTVILGGLSFPFSILTIRRYNKKLGFVLLIIASAYIILSIAMLVLFFVIV